VQNTSFCFIAKSVCAGGGRPLYCGPVYRQRHCRWPSGNCSQSGQGAWAVPPAFLAGWARIFARLDL